MIHIVESYGFFAVFVLILLEYACFPLPSEVILPLAGAMAAGSGWAFFPVLGWSVAAGVAGSLLCYGVGFFGGRPLLEAWKRRFPKTRRGLEASQATYERYAILSVGVGRLIPLCRTYISLIAGISRQRLPGYLLSTAAGVTVWNLVLIGLGYFFTENSNIVSKYYEQYKIFLLPCLLAAVAFVVGRLLWKRRRVKP